MNRVTPSPRLSDDPGMQRVRLEEVLRQHADAINQGAAGQLFNVVTVSADYAASTSDHVILVNPAGAMAVTLPAASSMLGKRITVKRANSTTHVVTIQPSAGLIDASSSVTLTAAWQKREFVSDGSQYYEVT